MGRMRYSTRLMVEDCRIYLSVTWLHRLARLFNRSPGEIVWLTLLDSLTGDPLARIECQCTFCEPHGLAVLIRVEDAEGGVLCNRQMVPVVVTHPHFGGMRFGFRCDCGRDARVLYLPEGVKGFQCRRCANLIHRSARRHDPTLYTLARDQAAILRALSSGSISTRLRGTAAFALRMRWETGHSKRQMSKVLH